MLHVQVPHLTEPVLGLYWLVVFIHRANSLIQENVRAARAGAPPTRTCPWAATCNRTRPTAAAWWPSASPTSTSCRCPYSPRERCRREWRTHPTPTSSWPLPPPSWSRSTSRRAPTLRPLCPPAQCPLAASVSS